MTEEVLNRTYVVLTVPQEMQALKKTDDAELFMLAHGEKIIDMLGEEVDRIEKIMKVRAKVMGSSGFYRACLDWPKIWNMFPELIVQPCKFKINVSVELASDVLQPLWS